MTSPANFKTIEAGRGIAALLVVLFHASNAIFPAEQYWHVALFGGIFDFGYAGVEFFFVLSGFIIAHVHAADIGMPARLKRYALRRFTRIYPVYWLVVAGVLGIIALPMGLSNAPFPELSVIITSLLLIGADSSATVLAVAWTLYHELAFYLVFGLWIISKRAGAIVTLLWLLIVLARWQHLGEIEGLPRYLSDPLNLLFLFGVGAWAISRRFVIPAPALVAGLASLAFIGVGCEAVYYHQWPESNEHLLFGLAAMIGLTAVVSVERHRVVAVPKLLVALGAASYSIYLVHFTLLSALAKIAARTGLRERLPPQIAFVVVVMIVVGLGYAFHRLIEKPLLKFSQRVLTP